MQAPCQRQAEGRTVLDTTAFDRTKRRPPESRAPVASLRFPWVLPSADANCAGDVLVRAVNGIFRLRVEQRHSHVRVQLVVCGCALDASLEGIHDPRICVPGFVRDNKGIQGVGLEKKKEEKRTSDTNDPCTL